MTSSADSFSRVADMRAKRGARWLDENFPGWEKRINMNTLRLNNGTSCICGQVFKKQAQKSHVDCGFGYAFDHLFAEANSWITSIVGPVSDKIDEKEFRMSRVSTALGFSDGSVSSNKFTWFLARFKSDDVNVNYDDLQKAWVKLLTQRKAAA